MDEADGEDVRIGDLVGGDDGRTEWAEGGEALGHGPLRGGELHVAGADVVDDGVAVDMVAPFLGGQAKAAVADDEGDLRLVVRLGGVDGKHDWVAGADDGGGQLEEDDRGCGDGHPGLCGVIAIVEADGEDARRIGQRRVEAHLAEWIGRIGLGPRYRGVNPAAITASASAYPAALRSTTRLSSSRREPGRMLPSAREKDTSFIGPPGRGRRDEGAGEVLCEIQARLEWRRPWKGFLMHAIDCGTGPALSGKRGQLR